MIDILFEKLKKIVPLKWHWVLDHEGFKKYIKNISWMFLGRIFTLFLSFFVSVYLARKLGVENFGILNFIMSFVSIAGTSIFVIDSLLIKKLNSEPENTNKILGTALIIKIVNAFFAIISAVLLAFLFANDKTMVPLVFAFSVFTIFQSFNVVDSYFQAHADVKKISILGMIVWTLSMLIKIVIITLNVNIIYLLLSYVLDHFMNAVGYVYLYNKYVGGVGKWRIDRSIFLNFIKNSWPFTISALATSVYIRIDQILLKVFLGSKEVGLYVVAVRFSEVWFFVSSVICASLLPAVLNSYKVNYRSFLSRSKNLYSLLFYSSLTICITVFLLSPVLVKVLYGDQYLPSIGILRIYIWSIIGVFMSTALQQFLLAENKLKTILVINLIGMITSVVLNIVFIPMYGMVGAAIVNIVAYTLPFIIIIFTKELKDQRQAVILGLLKPFKS